MAQYVQVGNDVIEFPDNMTDADISAALSKANQPAMPVPAKEEPSMLSKLGRQAGLATRAGITGLTSVPAAMADFLAGGVNLATGAQTMKPSSQGLQELMTYAGLPVAETGMERAAQAGMGAMTGTGAQAALAKQAGGMLAPLAANLSKQLPVAGVAGAASQPVAEETFALTGSPIAATIAGMATGAVVGGATGRGVDKLTGKPSAPPVTLEDIKQRSQRAYTSMEQQGITVKPMAALSMVRNIRNSLDNAGFIPNDPGTQRINALVDNYEAIIGNQRVPFTTLEKMRSMATTLKSSGSPDERRLAGIVVSGIDNKLSSLSGRDIMSGTGGVDKAVESVMSARKDWRTMSKAAVLDDVLNVAEVKQLNPNASESELIRKGLINLANSKSKMSLFSKTEQNAIKAVAKGGVTDPLLSLAAKFNPQRSQLVAGASLAGAVSNPLAAVVPTVGFTADKLQNYLRAAQTKGLISNILSGNVQAPLPSYGWRGMLSGMNPQLEQQQ